MKKLLIVFSLVLCVPAYSVEQTKALKKIKKNDGLKSDAIKGAITLAIALATRYYTQKIFNDAVAKIEQGILQDPRFAPYIRNGDIDVEAMPKDLQEQFAARSIELGVNNVTPAILKSLIPGLVSFGTGIAAIVYGCKVIYKSINRATSSNEDDENIEIEEEIEEVTA